MLEEMDGNINAHMSELLSSNDGNAAVNVQNDAILSREDYEKAFQSARSNDTDAKVEIISVKYDVENSQMVDEQLPEDPAAERERDIFLVLKASIPGGFSLDSKKSEVMDALKPAIAALDT